MNNRVRIYEPYGFGESYQYESIPTRIDNELSESQANDSLSSSQAWLTTKTPRH